MKDAVASATGTGAGSAGFDEAYFIAAGLAVVLLLAAERTGWRLGKWIFKPLASLGFLWLAFFGWLTGFPALQWLFVGMALSWLGDVLLIPSDRRTFIAGLIAFLFAHLAYLVAFTLPDAAWSLMALVTLALCVPAVIVGRWLLPNVPTRMRLPVVAYMVAITSMLAAALTAVSAWNVHWLLPAGAFLFYLSDLAVARDRFVAPGFVNRAWGLPAYYAGQYAILFGMILPG